jgi:uncharacterized membrane protein (DUF441 family)
MKPKDYKICVIVLINIRIYDEITSLLRRIMVHIYICMYTLWVSQRFDLLDKNGIYVYIYIWVYICILIYIYTYL